MVIAKVYVARNKRILILPPMRCDAMSRKETQVHAPVEPRGEEAPRLVSIVCPAFNEEESIAEFHRAVRRTLADMEQPFEVVFVNDGSTDGTKALIKALCERHPNTSLVDLSRNFGKEIAITAGLDHARGEAVVIMDADLQHPPELIGEMIAGWAEGYDIVNAVRRDRSGESAAKRIAAGLFYRIMNRVGRVELPRGAGDFRLLSRKAADAVIRLRERHRFMKGVFAWVGFPAKTVPFDVAPRFAGRTKFNFWRLWEFSLEGLTSHTLAPLKASTYLGLAVAAISFVSGLVYLAKTILFGDPAQGFPTMIVTMSFLGGVQLIVLGVIGEYLGRVFNETKNRPLYFVNEVVAPKSAGETAAGRKANAA
jgi:glycosyltransferase involved in cell wall biosynthesis